MNHPQASPSCGFTFYSALRMAKPLGFCVLHSVFSRYCLDCWSFCGPDNIRSSLGVPYWLLRMCLEVLESFFPHFSTSNSEYLTDSYGCVQWLQSLPPGPLTAQEWKEAIYVKIKTAPWRPSLIVLSMLHMTLTASVGTEDRAQWGTELESFPLPRPLSPQTQNREHGYVAVSIFNFSS